MSQQVLPKFWVLSKVIRWPINALSSRSEWCQIFVHVISFKKYPPNFIILYQILKEMYQKRPKMAKKCEKWLFWPFFNNNFFQNYWRYKKNFFTGMQWIHWGTFKPNMRCLNPETTKGPYILGNSCPFRTFLGVFDLPWPLGQHLGNNCWPKFWNIFHMP